MQGEGSRTPGWAPGRRRPTQARDPPPYARGLCAAAAPPRSQRNRAPWRCMLWSMRLRWKEWQRRQDSQAPPAPFEASVTATCCAVGMGATCGWDECVPAHASAGRARRRLCCTAAPRRLCTPAPTLTDQVLGAVHCACHGVQAGRHCADLRRERVGGPADWQRRQAPAALLPCSASRACSDQAVASKARRSRAHGTRHMARPCAAALRGARWWAHPGRHRRCTAPSPGCGSCATPPLTLPSPSTTQEGTGPPGLGQQSTASVHPWPSCLQLLGGRRAG